MKHPHHQKKCSIKIHQSQNRLCHGISGRRCLIQLCHQKKHATCRYFFRRVYSELMHDCVPLAWLKLDLFSSCLVYPGYLMTVSIWLIRVIEILNGSAVFSPHHAGRKSVLTCRFISSGVALPTKKVRVVYHHGQSQIPFKHDIKSSLNSRVGVHQTSVAIRLHFFWAIGVGGKRDGERLENHDWLQRQTRVFLQSRLTTKGCSSRG